MMMKVVENNMDVSAFIKLREEFGFKPYPRQEIEAALRNSLYCVHIELNGKTIAAARVVGDGRVAFFIKDVVVSEASQNQGYGNILMEHIFQYLHQHACEGAYIGLMSTVGKEAFYQRYGFIIRPNEEFGSGMALFLNKDPSYRAMDSNNVSGIRKED